MTENLSDKGLHVLYMSRINEVMDYIENNLSEPLTLEELANVAGFSGRLQPSQPDIARAFQFYRSFDCCNCLYRISRNNDCHIGKRAKKSYIFD